MLNHATLKVKFRLTIFAVATHILETIVSLWNSRTQNAATCISLCVAVAGILAWHAWLPINAHCLKCKCFFGGNAHKVRHISHETSWTISLTNFMKLNPPKTVKTAILTFFSSLHENRWWMPKNKKLTRVLITRKRHRHFTQLNQEWVTQRESVSVMKCHHTKTCLLSGTISRTKVQIEHREVASILWGEANLSGSVEYTKGTDTTIAVIAAGCQVQLRKVAEESWDDQRINSQEARRFVWSATRRNSWTRRWSWVTWDSRWTSELRIQFRRCWAWVAITFKVDESLKGFGSKRKWSRSTTNESEKPRSSSDWRRRRQARRTGKLGIGVERNCRQTWSPYADAWKTTNLLPRTSKFAAITWSHHRTKAD